MHFKKSIIMIILGLLLFTFLHRDVNYTGDNNVKESIVDALLIEEQNISKKDAIENVKVYLNKSNKYVPSFIEVDTIDGNYYIVHAYDIIKHKNQSHTTTTGWFYVNIYTGEVVDMIN